MHARVRQSCFLIILAFMGFGFLTTALAGSTTVTSTGIKFPDGTTQTTAASGGGSSLWSQSGSNIYYNSGNVGIGTTSPAYKLQVHDQDLGVLLLSSTNTTSGESGVALFNNGILKGVFQYMGTDSRYPNGRSDAVSIRSYATNGFRIVDTTATSTFFQVTNTGNVGIGTTSPNYPLEMGSGAHVTASGVWTDASSREYKENIRDLSYDEAKSVLSSLSPAKFNYKVDKDDEYLGFIAEDVPDLVATKDRKGLSPMDIVAVLTKVVQKQQEKIEALENLLNARQ